MKFWITMSALVITAVANAGEKYTINNNWIFTGESNQEAQRVDLPHTWNAADAMDDVPGYFRGKGHYAKRIDLGEEIEGKRVFLHFGGVNQEVLIKVNGQEAGTHAGGYTSFVIDITPYVKQGRNEIVVEVDNSHNPAIPPLSADFTFFGGIYRDVGLEIEEPVHISHSDYGASGMYVTTPAIREGRGDVNAKILIDNFTDSKQKVIVEAECTDGSNTVWSSQKRVTIPANALMHETEIAGVVGEDALKLWSPDNPNRYSLTVKVIEDNKEKKVLDEEVTDFGFRWHDFDPNTGFSLNGQPMKLVGTNRHQDFKDRGWALNDDYHAQDIKLLKDMGGNFLRVSHYPQTQFMMDLCDREGLLTSVEIPIVNAVTESPEFLDNCMTMMTEMIKQNYNHPSVIIWTYMNEVMLVPPYSQGTEEYTNYCAEVHRQAQELDSLSKSLDPTRSTMIPFHNSIKSYEDADLYNVPDVIGWNIYAGWYFGQFPDLEDFLDEYHAKYPDKPTIMTEYGADCDTRLHSDEPERFDYTMEYADLFQEHYLKALLNTDYLAGAALWNLNEFHSEGRGNAKPHVNLKGIVTMDRKPKNTYWLYKANFTDEPMVEFANANWTNRTAQLDSLGFYETVIKIYSNEPKLQVSNNGESLGEWPVEQGVAKGKVRLHNGTNRLMADGEKASATMNVNLLGIPYALDDNFTDISVMLGTKRIYCNPETQVCWIPEQPYRKGSWGYVGGEPMRPKNWSGTLPTSEVEILGTEEDPLYQTMRRGIEEMRFDVPKGRYAVYLHWADLTKEEYQKLAYNLGNDAEHEESDDAMVVSVMGQKIPVDVRRLVGRQRPLVIKVETNVEADGLNITFDQVKGQAFLNAIRVVRL